MADTTCKPGDSIYPNTGLPWLGPLSPVPTTKMLNSDLALFSRYPYFPFSDAPKPPLIGPVMPSLSQSGPLITSVTPPVQPNPYRPDVKETENFAVASPANLVVPATESKEEKKSKVEAGTFRERPKRAASAPPISVAFGSMCPRDIPGETLTAPLKWTTISRANGKKPNTPLLRALCRGQTRKSA